jgi:clan AA aspartic protease
MIHGAVVGLQAQVNLILCLPDQRRVEIECVVDTGFAGALTLPPKIVADLDLPFVIRMNANLADDSNVMTPIHQVVILWHGIERDIPVLAMGRRPLLGTALLEDSNLNVDFYEGGPVVVDELWFMISHLAAGQINQATQIYPSTRTAPREWLEMAQQDLADLLTIFPSFASAQAMQPN